MPYSASGIKKSYNGQQILNNIDIDITEGKATLLTGASGSGKSTLIRALSLLDTPDSGVIHRNNTVIWSAANNTNPRREDLYPDITCVFQQVYLWPNMTNKKNVMFSVNGRSSENEYHKYIERMNIEHVMNRHPNEISLGQRQRVGLVRALMLKPKYLFLDEISSALDRSSTNAVIDVLFEKLGQGVGMLAITHDPRLMECEIGDAIEMDQGRLVR
ncbi:ATP-binding cassette domain-containing protein [Endothiovibrio diazotrophicus]